MDEDGKLNGKIESMSWDDYKKCGYKMDKKYSFIQDNTVKVINNTVTTLV